MLNPGSPTNIIIPIAKCFASFVRLMPLDDGVSGLTELFAEDSELRTRAQNQRRFIDQLLNANHAENYEVHILGLIYQQQS